MVPHNPSHGILFKNKEMIKKKLIEKYRQENESIDTPKDLLQRINKSPPGKSSHEKVADMEIALNRAAFLKIRIRAEKIPWYEPIFCSSRRH